jgi:hypothetical protein
LNGGSGGNRRGSATASGGRSLAELSQFSRNRAGGLMHFRLAVDEHAFHESHSGSVGCDGT